MVPSDNQAFRSHISHAAKFVSRMMVFNVRIFEPARVQRPGTLVGVGTWCFRNSGQQAQISATSVPGLFRQYPCSDQNAPVTMFDCDPLPVVRSLCTAGSILLLLTTNFR